MRGNRGRRRARGVEAVPSLKRVSASATTRLNFPFLSSPSSLDVVDVLEASCPSVFTLCVAGIFYLAAVRLLSRP